MDGMRAMRRKTREQRRKLMRRQKLYGLFFVVLSIVICVVCSFGQTAEDCDATVILLLFPMGLYLLFSKEICIYG